MISFERNWFVICFLAVANSAHTKLSITLPFFLTVFERSAAIVFEFQTLSLIKISRNCIKRGKNTNTRQFRSLLDLQQLFLLHKSIWMSMVAGDSNLMIQRRKQDRRMDKKSNKANQLEDLLQTPQRLKLCFVVEEKLFQTLLDSTNCFSVLNSVFKVKSFDKRRRRESNDSEHCSGHAAECETSENTHKSK